MLYFGTFRPVNWLYSRPFWKKSMSAMLWCITWRRLVTGSVSGHLYLWEENRVGRAIKAHESSVNVIHAIEVGYISGGKDGGVKIWDLYCNPLKALQLMTFCRLHT